MENRFAIFSKLVREIMPATENQALLTHINNDIYRRIVEQNIKAMNAEARVAAGRAFVADPSPMRYQVLPFS